jgi:hypothetical protein
MRIHADPDTDPDPKHCFLAKMEVTVSNLFKNYFWHTGVGYKKPKKSNISALTPLIGEICLSKVFDLEADPEI